MPSLTCSAPKCDRDVYVKKHMLCQSHYNRFNAYGDLNVETSSGPCVHCGRQIPPKGASGPPARYCTKKCRRDADQVRNKDRRNAEARAFNAQKPKSVHECESCGDSFESSHRISRFCSTRCSTQFRRDHPDGSCSTVGCHRSAEARGLCHACYKRDARGSGRIKPSVWNDRRRANYHKRRALKLELPADNIRPLEVFERDGWICGICADPVDRTLKYPDPKSPSLDHVIPLSKGGHHVMENVQLACLDCNVRKGDRESVAA